MGESCGSWTHCDRCGRWASYNLDQDSSTLHEFVLAFDPLLEPPACQLFFHSFVDLGQQHKVPLNSFLSKYSQKSLGLIVCLLLLSKQREACRNETKATSAKDSFSEIPVT